MHMIVISWACAPKTGARVAQLDRLIEGKHRWLRARSEVALLRAARESLPELQPAAANPVPAGSCFSRLLVECWRSRSPSGLHWPPNALLYLMICALFVLPLPTGCSKVGRRVIFTSNQLSWLCKLCTARVRATKSQQFRRHVIALL